LAELEETNKEGRLFVVFGGSGSGRDCFGESFAMLSLLKWEYDLFDCSIALVLASIVPGLLILSKNVDIGGSTGTSTMCKISLRLSCVNKESDVMCTYSSCFA